MIGIQTKSSSFNCIIDYPVEHTNSSDARVEGDADPADAVVGRGGHLPGTPSSVFIVAVVLRHWVVVIAVDVGRRKWVVVSPSKNSNNKWGYINRAKQTTNNTVCTLRIHHFRNKRLNFIKYIKTSIRIIL